MVVVQDERLSSSCLGSLQLSGSGGLDLESLSGGVQLLIAAEKVSGGDLAGHIGNRVLVGGAKEGILRYFGPLHLKPEQNFCGIQLLDPDGKHDGSLDGHHYFSCPPGHGIFAPTAKVQLIALTTLSFHSSISALPASASSESASQSTPDQPVPTDHHLPPSPPSDKAPPDSFRDSGLGTSTILPETAGKGQEELSRRSMASESTEMSTPNSVSEASLPPSARSSRRRDTFEMDVGGAVDGILEVTDPSWLVTSTTTHSTTDNPPDETPNWLVDTTKDSSTNIADDLLLETPPPDFVAESSPEVQAEPNPPALDATLQPQQLSVSVSNRSTSRASRDTGYDGTTDSDHRSASESPPIASNSTGTSASNTVPNHGPSQSPATPRPPSKTPAKKKAAGSVASPSPAKSPRPPRLSVLQQAEADAAAASKGPRPPKPLSRQQQIMKEINERRAAEAAKPKKPPPQSKIAAVIAAKPPSASKGTPYTSLWETWPCWAVSFARWVSLRCTLWLGFETTEDWRRRSREVERRRMLRRSRLPPRSHGQVSAHAYRLFLSIVSLRLPYAWLRAVKEAYQFHSPHYPQPSSLPSFSESLALSCPNRFLSRPLAFKAAAGSPPHFLFTHYIYALAFLLPSVAAFPPPISSTTRKRLFASAICSVEASVKFSPDIRHRLKRPTARLGVVLVGIEVHSLLLSGMPISSGAKGTAPKNRNVAANKATTKVNSTTGLKHPAPRVPLAPLHSRGKQPTKRNRTRQEKKRQRKLGVVQIGVCLTRKVSTIWRPYVQIAVLSVARRAFVLFTFHSQLSRAVGNRSQSNHYFLRSPAFPRQFSSAHL